MALNTDIVPVFEKNSQNFESRRSLFPQHFIDSGEESDLGCMSVISNSSSEEEYDVSNSNTSNIEDYDIIGIVRKDTNLTPETTPNTKYSSLIIDESPLGTPNSKMCQPTTSKDAFSLTSPTYNLKTPHDTLTVNTKVPKLTHKSLTDTCSSVPIKRKLSPYHSPELLNNSLKVDTKNPKVRQTLFPESELYLPTKKFYSSSESVMEQLKEHKKQTAESFMESMRKHKTSVKPSSSINSRKRAYKRKTIGRINAGVTHKIRKPKQKKVAPLSLAKSLMSETESKALRYYLDNLKELQSSNDSNKLLENKENTPEISAVISSSASLPTNQTNVNYPANNHIQNLIVQKNSNNGFDYSSPTTAQILPNTTINYAGSNLFCENQFVTTPSTASQFPNKYDPTTSTYQAELETVQNYTQFAIKKNVAMDQNSTNQFASSIPSTTTFSKSTFPSNHSSMSNNKSYDMENSKKRPLSPMVEESEEPGPAKKFFKFSRAHKAVVTMNQSMKLIMDHGKVSLIGGSNDINSVTQNQPKFVPEDFEVEEPIMSQVVMDNILSTLEGETFSGVNGTQQQPSVFPQSQPSVSFNSIGPSLAPGSIIASSTNPAHLMLSPISQMCDVTSGLALSSPKKVKNLSSLIANVSRSPKKGFLLPPRESVGKKKALTLTERKFKRLHKDQMLLDAGQKKFGVTQCSECNFVYHMGDPIDESAHMNYHEGVPVLRFGGWKNERIVADVQQKGRIIQIKRGDPKIWWKKVSDVMEFINRDMGCCALEFNLENSQVFLCIKSKTIAGCLVAVETHEGYRMLTTKSHETDLCSERSFPVKCGVARIWVSHNFRKQGVGTALMNVMKKNFFFGSVLNNSEIAFSSPTEMGKAFAKKYFNTPNYMIYFW